MTDGVLKKFLYIVFPRRCRLCGEVVGVKEELCPECARAKLIGDDICKKCGREKERCECKKDKFSPKYNAVTAPYYYGKSIEKGIIRFKEYDFPELGEGMSERIASRVNEQFDGVKFDLTACVPMTKAAQRKRGYNQSEILARSTARLIGAKYSPLLVKIRKTPHQRFSSADERRVNLFGAFDLAKGADVEGKTILVVDDVKTTGSTLSECAAVLKAYGAKDVYAAAFALTDKKDK